MVLRQVTYSALLFMVLVLLGGLAAPQAEAQTQPEAQQEQQPPQQPGAPPPAAFQPDPEQIETAERECRDRLQTVEAEAVMPDTKEPLLPRTDLNVIREAALAFARAGHQQGCEQTAGELQTLLQERRQKVERERELQRVRQAIPLPQLPFTVTTSNLVGSKVVNHELEELGTLEDLILTEREGRYALIKHGGFLGIGRNHTPVALERLRMTEDGELLVVHVSQEAFEEAPDVEPDQLTEVGSWAGVVDEWWLANVGPAPVAGQPAQPQQAPAAPAPEEAPAQPAPETPAPPAPEEAPAQPAPETPAPESVEPTPDEPVQPDPETPDESTPEEAPDQQT